MSKRQKHIISILIVLLVIAVLTYNYMYQDHRDIKTEASAFVLDTEVISSNFSENITEAETTYLNKTIEVSGLISETDPNSITLDDKVFCQFSKTINQSITLNSTIKIKGRVIGYDDLLEQVKLDQCTIMLNN